MNLTFCKIVIWISVLCAICVSTVFSQSLPQGKPNQPTDSIFFELRLQLEEAKKKSSVPQIAKSHFELGEFYQTAGVFSEAIDQFNQALEILGDQKKDTLNAMLNNCIGKVHLSLNKFELAEQYFKESVDLSNELKYTEGQAISKGLLGSCYEKKGDYLEALKYQRQSLSLFEELQDLGGISMTNENIGSIYEDLGQFDLAQTFFLKSYEYLAGRDTEAEANVLNNIGDAYRKKGNYEEAVEFTQKALNVAKKLGDNHQLESAHKDLSKAFALIEDYERAHFHLGKAEEYYNAWLEAQNINQVNVLQTIYETNKKEAEIELLKEQNKVSVANQNLLWFALFAIAVILSVLYIYLGRKRKAKLKIQEYKQRMLKAELDKKAFEEKNLQREIQLKAASLSRYSLHLAQKNKILLDLSKTLTKMASRQNMNVSVKIKELAREIEFNLQQEHEWDEFMSFFKEIHPDFIKKLSSLSENNLSPAELRLGMLLRLNLSSKEIASILRVTPDSVRVARHRLRKKLPIDQKEELVNFMVEL